MRLRHNSDKGLPQLNTAALPDLIFTVLFFFMIVTHMRQTDISLRIRTPDGVNLEKIEKRHSMSYLYLGKDDTGNMRIQFGDKYINMASLPDFVNRDRDRLPADEQSEYTVSIKADKSVQLKAIAEIKAKLREANVTHINYSATENIKKP
ncbi:MAG: biopolymer transporter ExbD [Prevotella sp.]|nr:biopolymer transporter ExbD [Prevotella sp.]